MAGQILKKHFFHKLKFEIDFLDMDNLSYVVHKRKMNVLQKETEYGDK